jgi:hypothetical protein
MPVNQSKEDIRIDADDTLRVLVIDYREDDSTLRRSGAIERSSATIKGEWQCAMFAEYRGGCGEFKHSRPTNVADLHIGGTLGRMPELPGSRQATYEEIEILL